MSEPFPPISQVLAGIQHIPDRSSQDLLEFDAAATQFADEIKTLGIEANTWATQANALAAAINIVIGLINDPGNPDILRFVRSPGDILYTAAHVPPTGTLLANGAAVSRATYPDLFAKLVTAPAFPVKTFTCTTASPTVVTSTAHGFTGGERLRLTTTGTLPTGLILLKDYIVIPIDTNTFHLSNSQLEIDLVNVTGAGNGTHSYQRSLWGLGDGTTTFNVPNLLGVFPRGVDEGRGIDANRKLGTYQKGTLVTGDLDGIASTGVVSLSTTINKSGQDKLGADVPKIAAYPDLQFASITQTGWLPVADRPDLAGVVRPANVALLPCVVY